MLRVYLHYKPVIRTSPIYKITDFEWVPITLLLALLVITILRILIFFYRRKNRHPCGCLFSLGRGIRIRTLNDGVRASQSFFKTAYLSRFSDFASLKNLSQVQNIFYTNKNDSCSIVTLYFNIISITSLKTGYLLLLFISSSLCRYFSFLTSPYI